MALLLALLLALIFAAARAGGLEGAYYEAHGAWLPLAAGSTQPLPVADRSQLSKRGAAGAEEAQRALVARGQFGQPLPVPDPFLEPLPVAVVVPPLPPDAARARSCRRN